MVRGDAGAKPDAVSWWWEEAGRAGVLGPPCASLAGVVQADVAIVGGGFTGLWTALALKERAPQLSVVLLEAALCGSGASGKNGGKVHGYWASLPGMAKTLGEDAALEVARTGTMAQDAVRAFSTAPGRDVWWRESGNMRVSTVPAQDAKIEVHVGEARRLGVPETAVRLTPAEVQARCQSPVFRGGVFFPEGANVHPLRLALALKQAALAAGVRIHENTPMLALDRGAPNRVRTAGGEVVAREVVLATNAALATEPHLQPYLCVLSSFAVMSEPAPEALERIGWRAHEGITDLRMFLHYFRKTADRRVLMGSGSGPIGYGGRADDPRLHGDRASAQRAVRGLKRLLPAVAAAGIAKAWGGAIDVSSDRLPFFGTLPGTRVHYACGYSGHGVNATWIGGQCLASLALASRDAWTASPLCTRTLPRLPPEPFRTIGGRAIRWGILQCEEAEERQVRPPLPARTLAALPQAFGLRIGTR